MIKNIYNRSILVFSLMGVVLGCNTPKKENTVIEKITTTQEEKVKTPIVIATWNTPEAVATAVNELNKGKTALDAVEHGCRVEEANVNNNTVGIGGLPDRDGYVSLDACVMNEKGDYGAVVGVENIKHVVSLARKVMEETPHVMLSGKGAEQFAISQGFPVEDLLTEKSKEAWKKWKETSEYKPVINIENHDTIGMLAMDNEGNISGACTTSGLAYKMRGRIGDSPIIGGGLYIDNEVGGAVATGLGEEVLKSVGSYLVVELMRQGKSPQEACELAVKRIVDKSEGRYKDFQVAFVAINKKGEIGGYAIHEWFNYTQYKNGSQKNVKSDYYLKEK